MKIRRSELDILLKWLNKPNRKPLIIRGARQVGKSTLVRQLAEENQFFCLELNFERTPSLSDFFSDKNPKHIIQKLSLYAKRQLRPDNTILFLDEIQAAPEILEVLRYFYEEYPEFPVIAAGSLLDFILEAPAYSVPVGRIEYFHLTPLSFNDFLTAIGEVNLANWIREWSLNDDIPALIHQQCLDLVKQFWLIGGMPEIVAHFSEYRDFQEINNMKHNILQTYQDDFHKYGRAKEIPLLRQTFKKIPALIGNTIKYASIDRDSKSIYVKEALDNLNLAKIIYLVRHSDSTGIPLRSHINHKVFKVILLDIGLLCAALDLDYLSIINAPDWAWVNRGSLAEQFIGQSLLKLKPFYQEPELFYWVREKPQSSAELDYIFQYKNNLIPVEIKAGKTGQLKSLHYFIKEKKWSFGVRFNADMPSFLHENINLSDNASMPYTLLSLPFYFAEQLERLIPIEALTVKN